MMDKKYLAGALLLLVMVSAYYFLSEKKNEGTVCFGDKCFLVETAENKEERARGLMFREHMDWDRGMLFVFQNERVYPFWMKNTLIPLDIIWMNHEKEVVYIEHRAQPCRTEECPLYDPKKPALYVLELNGGAANESGIDIGDKAVF
jgi:uncharacterized membrane protein (UPF0127 family)